MVWHCFLRSFKKSQLVKSCIKCLLPEERAGEYPALKAEWVFVLSIVGIFMLTIPRFWPTRYM